MCNSEIPQVEAVGTWAIVESNGPTLVIKDSASCISSTSAQRRGFSIPKIGPKVAQWSRRQGWVVLRCTRNITSHLTNAAMKAVNITRHLHLFLSPLSVHPLLLSLIPSCWLSPAFCLALFPRLRFRSFSPSPVRRGLAPTCRALAPRIDDRPHCTLPRFNSSVHALHHLALTCLDQQGPYKASRSAFVCGSYVWSLSSILTRLIHRCRRALRYRDSFLNTHIRSQLCCF